MLEALIIEIRVPSAMARGGNAWQYMSNSIGYKSKKYSRITGHDGPHKVCEVSEHGIL